MPNKMAKITEGFWGAAKDVKAGFSGLTGVFTYLMEEHAQVGAMMQRLAKSEDEEVRSVLYPKIRKELIRHEAGELKVIYAALAELPGAGGIDTLHASQSSELRRAIAEVDALSFGDAAWPASFERLAKLVDEHVELEESDFFPRAQRALGEERAERLLPQFESAKKQA